MVKYKCKRSKVIYILLEERRNTMTETSRNAAIATTEENKIKKLDYSLKTAEERKAHVEAMVAEMSKDQLKNKKYIEILSDYIVSAMTPEEKKSKMILTDNRMITVNKRETSYQGLVSKFENGEDGLWNLIIDDKNVLLTHKVSITEKEWPNHSHLPYRRSLVIPASSSTMAWRSPIIRLKIVDLPTFGLPTIATMPFGMLQPPLFRQSFY